MAMGAIQNNALVIAMWLAIYILIASGMLAMYAAAISQTNGVVVPGLASASQSVDIGSTTTSGTNFINSWYGLLSFSLSTNILPASIQVIFVQFEELALLGCLLIIGRGFLPF